MATRLTHVVIDASDPAAQARFWAAALGWEVTVETADEVCVEPPDGAPGIELIFGTVPEVKTGKNRLHLDLASESSANQAVTVERLQRLGARLLDIGQGEVPWVVLADPEGNELCVLEPRDSYRDTGALAAIVVSAADPVVQAAFWEAAAGWPVERVTAEFAALRAAPLG